MGEGQHGGRVKDERGLTWGKDGRGSVLGEGEGWERMEE